MSFFQQHVFICTNQREDGQMCCNNHGARASFDYLKTRANALGLDYQRLRISKASCLGRCDLGPVLVVYPEGVWYTFVDNSDLDEILESHLLKGQVVTRLTV